MQGWALPKLLLGSLVVSCCPWAHAGHSANGDEDQEPWPAAGLPSLGTPLTFPTCRTVEGRSVVALFCARSRAASAGKTTPSSPRRERRFEAIGVGGSDDRVKISCNLAAKPQAPLSGHPDEACVPSHSRMNHMCGIR